MAIGKTNYPGGGVDTSDATAGAGDIVSPKTAYGSAGTKLTGTVTEKVGSATVITPSTSDQAIPAGRYGGDTGDGKVLGDADLVAGNIKSGVNIFGVAGTLEGATLEADASVTDGTEIINYRKVGKIYFLTGRQDASKISGQGYRNDSNTASRLATALGITLSSYQNDISTAYFNARYWNGSSWAFTGAGTYTAISSLIAV